MSVTSSDRTKLPFTVVLLDTLDGIEVASNRYYLLTAFSLAIINFTLSDSI